MKNNLITAITAIMAFFILSGFTADPTHVLVWEFDENNEYSYEITYPNGETGQYTHDQLPQLPILLNGTLLKCNALNKDNRTFVPIRVISENLEAEVKWYPEDNRIMIQKNSVIIKLKINDRIAEMNGKKVTLDVSPFIYENSTYVPVRFISESFGAKVSYITGDSKIVRTHSGNITIDTEFQTDIISEDNAVSMLQKELHERVNRAITGDEFEESEIARLKDVIVNDINNMFVAAEISRYYYIPFHYFGFLVDSFNGNMYFCGGYSMYTNIVRLNDSEKYYYPFQDYYAG